MVARWMAQAALKNDIADQGVRYAWVIDKEYDEGWKPIEEIAGPSEATKEEIARARKGQPFRMDYDGDGPALSGRIWVSDTRRAQDSAAGFQPLEDYGEGGYGCTAILYRNSNGAWEAL